MSPVLPFESRREMIVRRFMQWAATASAADRAKGAAALARAYLYSDLDEDDRDEADVALTALLDDPSPCVRKALAETMAASAGAPHAIVVALANDQSEISSQVLRYSPLLGDCELIDCAAIGDAFAQASVALRVVVSAPVAAALAEVGGCEALVALAVNPGADIPEFSLRRMVERFGHDAEVREGLLSRENLPPAVRSLLVAATARALDAFVSARGWLSPARMDRIVRESCDRAHLIIAADPAPTGEGVLCGARALAAHLRASGQLTPSLVLRALFSGNRALFEAALVELADLPERKALGLLRARDDAGFAIVYRAAKMPAPLLPGFLAAVHATQAMPVNPSARLSRTAIERVVRSCEAINAGEMNALLALLRRFEAEAAREDACERATRVNRDMAQDPTREGADQTPNDITGRTVVAMQAADVQLMPHVDPYVPPPTRAPRVIEIDLVRFEAELAA